MQYIRQNYGKSKWVNRIEESFSGDFSSTHTTYERNYRTAVVF
jgi:hypothetical protein